MGYSIWKLQTAQGQLPMVSEGVSVLMTPVGSETLKDAEQVLITAKTCFRRMYLAAVCKSDWGEETLKVGRALRSSPWVRVRKDGLAWTNIADKRCSEGNRGTHSRGTSWRSTLGCLGKDFPKWTSLGTPGWSREFGFPFPWMLANCCCGRVHPLWNYIIGTSLPRSTRLQ